MYVTVEDLVAPREVDYLIEMIDLWNDRIVYFHKQHNDKTLQTSNQEVSWVTEYCVALLKRE